MSFSQPRAFDLGVISSRKGLSRKGPLSPALFILPPKPLTAIAIQAFLMDYVSSVPRFLVPRFLLVVTALVLSAYFLSQSRSVSVSLAIRRIPEVNFSKI
jgi:hypothetical protein